MQRDRDRPDRVARDRWLLAEVAVGDPDARERAVDELYGSYQPEFLRAAKAQLRSQEAAEEVMQDFWIGVLKLAKPLDPEVPPGAWLWGVLQHRIADALRRRTDRRENGGDVHDPALEAVVEEAMHRVREAAPAADADIATKQLRDCVDRAYREFKRSHFEAAWLLWGRHVLDWTMNEVVECRRRLSGKDGGTEGAARQFLSDARRKFGRLVEPCIGRALGRSQEAG